MGSDNILPPRQKNWKPGNYQVGIFMRTPKGGVIQFCNDDATSEHAELLMLLFQENKHVTEFVKAHKSALEAAVKKASGKG